MSPSSRRAIWLIVLSLLLVGVVVAGWYILLRLREPTSPTLVPLRWPAPVYDAPAELASISVPHRPTSLTWSADGAYLAAGTGDSEVYVADVAKAAVATTLRVTGAVQALAFSPDGKWLVVATQQVIHLESSPAVLVAFDVPAFTPKFTAKLTAKANNLREGFLDVAWAPDSKTLYAIAPERLLGEKREIRRWSVPAFTEQAAIRSPQTDGYSALAVSPDSRTLAVADGPGGARVIRLLDLGKGTEKSSIQLQPKYTSGGPIRLGFTPDGKTVGVFGTDNSDPAVPGAATEWHVGLYWWDVATGRPAKPDLAHFTTQPAGMDSFTHSFSTAVSADGAWKALGSESHLAFQWNNRTGAFIRLTNSATGKTWTWRVGETQGSGYAPALAFSPDGRKLAGTVVRPSGRQGGELDSWILIWPVPK